MRGLARTLVNRLREGAGIQINVMGPIFQWALRHAGWLISHFRRHNGSPTAYEMVTGRKFQGKLAIFGERVLARLPGGNGDDKFRPAVWLGKTDRADFHVVATSDGLRWTRAVRRMPVAFEAAVLNNVRTWPWSVAFGQIGTKATPLITKNENVALPPDLSVPLRLQERQDRRQARQAQQSGGGQQALEDGDQGQAGPDEAASDPTSKSLSASPSFLSMSSAKEIDDDTLLEDLVVEVKKDKNYADDVETSPKRGGEAFGEEEQSPSKAARVMPKKAMRFSEGEGREQPTSALSASSTSGAGGEAQPAGDPQVRVVVAGELLEDGDMDMEFPDRPPDLSPDELTEVENQAAELEIKRLIDMGVLRTPRAGEDLSSTPTLTTRLVCDWRVREGTWQRRARLVARDFNWLDPNRSDTFAPTGTQSTMRLVPALSQLKQWKMMVADVKDAYLNCEQPKNVKVVLGADLASRLGVAREWMLGKVLPGQREGAAVWFNTLKATLKDGGLLQCAEAPTVWTNREKTLALMIHVDDMVMTGEDEELEKVEAFLKKKFQLKVESGTQLSFLKRSIEVVDGVTKVKVNEKYIEGLVNLFPGVKRRKTPGDIIIDNEPLTNDIDIQKYRSAVWTLLYVSGDRPDTQFFIKELAAKLQVPTRGSMSSLLNLIGYMVTTKDIHVEMTGTDPGRSFRYRAEGLTTAPTYVEKDGIWLIEVATDSDWSGHKETRSSTSCGSMYLGGIWIHSYSRTQKNITLSSSEAEFVALVGGASEGLFIKAVVEHLVDGKVELKVLGDNTASIAIAARDGVCRLKHVSGRLLWIQQRQQRGELQLRRIDTVTNVADMGTKVLAGRRVRMLLHLCGFQNDWGDLGVAEFEEEKYKKDAREKIKAVRKIVHAEVLDTPTRENSTLVNQVAKRLMRLTLGALLLSGGEALSLPHQSSAQCLVAMDTTSSSLPWTTTMLVTLVFILVVTIIVLIKIMHVMHLRIEATREAMDWVRQQLRQSRDRVRIRNEEQQRLGVWLETDDEEDSDVPDQGGGSDGEDPHVNGRVAHIRRMTKEEFYNGSEEEMESEMEEVEVEVEPESGSAGAAGSALAPAASSMVENDFDFDFDSISMSGANLGGGDDGYVSQNDMEQEEEEDEVDTDYGSLVGIDEDFSVFENLDSREYDDYRFLLLAEGRGVEDYIIKKLAFLRSLPVTREVWTGIQGIQEFFNIHKAVQLGGIEVRKRAIRFLLARKRYIFWYEQGRVPPGELLEETEMVDEWLAAHYGWGEPTTAQPSAGPNDESDWSPSEGPVGITDGSGDERDEREERRDGGGGTRDDGPPPVVTEEVAPATGSSSTTTTTSKAKGKCGGKGHHRMDLKDPPMDDEADGHV